MVKQQQALSIFDKWYKALKIVKSNQGPAIGTIAATLILLENLKTKFDLNFGSHIAEGGAQIKGASGARVAAILKGFGEERPFAKEGGRTNRGGQGDIKPLFIELSKLNLDVLPNEERLKIIISLQEYLVERVRDFHNRQKIKLAFDPKLSTWHLIRNLLEEAKKEGKAGYVAQHLVGAKLQLRFPAIPISNESASTADKPTNRQGDFQIGDTIFHITVAPMQAVYEKCRQNIAEGFKVYLLVPDAKLAASRQMAEEFCHSHIAVESLESFVSQNMDELSGFNGAQLKDKLGKLIHLYNQRVDAVEVDKSLMIELPSNIGPAI